MCVPYLFAVHLDVGHIVLEHGGHVHLRELVFAEHNQKAGFTAGAVSDDHQLLTDGRHLGTSSICSLLLCWAGTNHSQRAHTHTRAQSLRHGLGLTHTLAHANTTMNARNRKKISYMYYEMSVRGSRAVEKRVDDDDDDGDVGVLLCVMVCWLAAAGRLWPCCVLWNGVNNLGAARNTNTNAHTHTERHAHKHGDTLTNTHARTERG